MENIVIGTAGHVDHGKTTLIKALTGIETDTTEEEKERGMSINIGFAYFDLPSGRRAGIVDVPGHEKFIKNMMAGLAGLNLILLVIDAGEGIMPQTKEHIDILHLLGIKDYIIVISKIGTVDSEMVELVEDDIREQVKGTHLETAPIMKVDSVSGYGLEELKEKIDTISNSIEQKNTLLPPRMHIDRVFSVKGHGTIVTGTLIEGKIKLNDELVIYPAGIQTKVRSIQVHEVSVAEAVAGQRTALNLANVKVSEITRGDTLSASDTMENTWMLDVKATVLPDASHSIQLWDRLRLHLGTQEVLCRAVPLGVEEILVGEEGYLQLRLEEQVVAQRGDRCILRTYSPMETIGGAVILETTPTKHRRFNEDLLENLKIKEQGSTEDLISEFIAKHFQSYATISEVVGYIGLEQKEVEEILQQLIDTGQVIKLNHMYFHTRKYEELKEKMIGILDRFHKTYRLRNGMPKEEVRSKIDQKMKGKDFDLLLEKMATDKIIKNEEVISLYDFQVTYNKYQLQDKEHIEQKLLEAKFMPLGVENFTNGKDDMKELINSLNGKTLLYLDTETIIHMDYYNKAVEIVKETIMNKGEISLGEFRDISQSSRKSATLIMEHMDKMKITKRVENIRVLY